MNGKQTNNISFKLQSTKSTVVRLVRPFKIQNLLSQLETRTLHSWHRLSPQIPMEICIINSVPFSAAFCKASSILASSFCLLSCKYFSSFSASYLTPVNQVGRALILNVKLHKCIIKQCTPSITSCCKTPYLRERPFFFHCSTLQSASKPTVFTQLCIISQNFSVEIQTPKSGLCNVR